MKVKPRPYQKASDLQTIGTLIRRVYALDPYWNSWSFALYDIWSQRKLGDREVFGITDWQQDICLWEEEHTGLVGAAMFRDSAFVKLVVRQEYRDLMTPMLDWVEARFQEKQITDKQLTIETIESNPFLEELLAKRSYGKDAGYYIFREKVLTRTEKEPVTLPPGFTIQHIQTADDLKKFHRGTEIVFNFPDNPDVYQILRQAPSFVPELDLILLSPEGEIASFGSAWFDRNLSLAEFEPVGTLPKFRKMGLGKALINDACNRLRDFSCQRVTVMSWNESPGANRLYESSGFLQKIRKNYWKKGDG